MKEPAYILYGSSSLRTVNLQTGNIIKSRMPPMKNAFGEGITVFNNKIYQLTYKEGKAFVYDMQFNHINTLSYQGEGWGLTHDDRHLIMSNGSSTLFWRDPQNLSIQRQIRVTDRGQEVSGLNELEYVNGQIYANVFPTTRIARIDPESGQITGWLDTSSLQKEAGGYNRNAVSNGIAYHPDRDTFFITGKYWSKVFEVKLIDSESTPIKNPMPQPVQPVVPVKPVPVGVSVYLQGHAQSIQPSMNGFEYSGNRLIGTLYGPGNANFNLYLYQRPVNSKKWKIVARSTGPYSKERIEYKPPRGNYVYRWQIHAATGQSGMALFHEQRD